ncbi:MAG TPA: response regulator [Polyangiaceae bacterium]|nr:response regulator [Polyangiaceae bacterium]
MTATAIDVLLVDDESRNLDALEAILTDPGYRLIRATNADEALRKLLEYEVAAIVLDIRMPVVSGYELARIIKGTKKFRQIPIVFLTAHMIEDDDVIAGYGAGAVDYLTKPVNPDILRHKIAMFADLFRKTRALAELNATLEARVQERTAELEKSEAALREAAQQKDEFLATLAHELRNPLAPLRMGLDWLLRTQPATAGAARTLSIMNRQLDHMVRLIDDLLDVARISGGLLELKKERVDLATVIENAREMCRPFFEQRRQRLEVQSAESLHVVGDPVRLAQIVGNLLHNASKFSPEGGEVELKLTYDDGRAVLQVVDGGVGIASDRMPLVFNMFARVDRETRGSNSGLGIGLALSRKLAQMHGGDLTASSSGVGEGSVFTLFIPAEPDAADPRPEEAISAPPKKRTNLDVLIIEDNEDSAEILMLWLTHRGCTARIASTGEQGLELAQAAKPDIILCDIGLPDMAGTEVCRRIREQELGYRPVVVALTGWGTEEDRRQTREAGFDYHLVKPVPPEKLEELLALDTRRRVSGDTELDADVPPR